MPAVRPPATVLVTGASGFIASWVCKALLHAGYGVRGTVRSSSKGDYLKRLFAEIGDRFQYVLVKDVSRVSGYRIVCMLGLLTVIHSQTRTMKP